MRRPARACRRCRMPSRAFADGDFVEMHTWGCDPSLPPDPDPDVVVAALHLDGAALLEVLLPPDVIDLQAALVRQREDRTRQMLADGLIDEAGEPTTFVRPAGDGTGIVGLDLDVDADLWQRNMVAIRRELFPGEAGFVPLADRTPPAFTSPPPADWRPLSTSPLWDDLDLYRDDVVDPDDGPRHARRSVALAARTWTRDAPGRAWGVLCETGRFLQAFPVLAAALAERWLAEAAACAEHEYANGYAAGYAAAESDYREGRTR